MKDLVLSKNEKDIYKSLVNPDDAKSKKYRWDIRYQQEILGMLLMDKVFLVQSMELIKPAYFIEKAHETICSIVFKYFSKYKQLPPKFVIVNEIKERYPNDARKMMICVGELEAIATSFVPGLESRDACLDKITEFAREQSLREAVSTTLDLLEKGDQDKWLKIESLFKEALLTDRSFDFGLDYFDSLEERYQRMEEQSHQKEVFITGFDSIDDPMSGLAAGGLCRKEIGAFLGLSGTGKSMLLAKAAVKNLIRGKKVLYISLEMDEDKIAKRFDAMLARHNIRSLLENKTEVIDALKERVKDEEDKRRLVIKQFPAGTATVGMIQSYLAQLNLYGFKPDLLCVDYVGEFKDDPDIKTYESRQRVIRDLRALGVEENHCTLTAIQANRRGRDDQNESQLDDNSLADSFGQARPLDALWSINQNTAEKDQGIGRIFVVKHRDGRSRYQLYFKQDKETLDLLEISAESYNNIRSLHAKTKSEMTDNNVHKVIGNKNFKPNGGR